MPIEYDVQTGIAVAIFVGVVSAANLLHVEATPEELVARAVSKHCTNGSISARLTARDAVRRNLISPRSASFSDERVAHLGDCQLEATGFVYAQNAFGAEIRSVYIVSLQYHPERDTWDTLDVMIQ